MGHFLTNKTTQTLYSKLKSKTCPDCGKEIQPFSLNVWGEIRWYPGTCECEIQRQEQEQQMQQEKERKEYIQQLFTQSQLTDKMLKQSFSNWEQRPGTEKALQLAQDMARNFEKRNAKKQGLLIFGNPGNGKSHLSAAIANYLIPRGVSVIFQSTEDLLNKIIESYYCENSFGRREKIMRPLFYCDLLILDDLGVRRLKEGRWEERELYSLIDGRYRSDKPIIITTNIPLSRLKETVTERIYDRLLEMCLLVENKGKSFRREIAQQRIKNLQRKGGLDE